MKRNLPLLIIAGVLLAAIAAGAVLYRRMKPAPQQPAPQKSTHTVAPGADPPRARGQMSAPVMIEEFGDFECPPCGILHPILKEIEKEYGEKLVVVFRHNPLPQIHKHAYDAARAAEAAGMQGKFWEMHDKLYEKQNEWNVAPDPRALFTGYAKDLGIDADRFARDMTAEIVTARVTLDMRRGRSLGVTGTPTLFVEGRQLPPEEVSAEGLRRAISAVLQEKEKKQ